MVGWLAGCWSIESSELESIFATSERERKKERKGGRKKDNLAKSAKKTRRRKIYLVGNYDQEIPHKKVSLERKANFVGDD